MYFEFLFRRAHSRKRVDRMYWSGVSLYSLTTCSKEVTVGTTGPIGSGLPQFGFPRRFAMNSLFLCGLEFVRVQRESVQSALQRGREGVNHLLFYEEFLQKSIARWMRTQLSMRRRKPEFRCKPHKQEEV